MSVLTYVEGSFTAIHAPWGQTPHGHDWFVRATFKNPNTIHYARFQEQLDEFLEKLDHGDLTKFLPREDTNEGVAEYIGTHLGAHEVEVYRFEKSRRFGAIWRA